MISYVSSGIDGGAGAGAAGTYLPKPPAPAPAPAPTAPGAAPLPGTPGQALPTGGFTAVPTTGAVEAPLPPAIQQAINNGTLAYHPPTATAPTATPPGPGSGLPLSVFGTQTDAGNLPKLPPGSPGILPGEQPGQPTVPVPSMPAPPPNTIGQNFTFQPFPVPNTTSVPATPVNFTPVNYSPVAGPQTSTGILQQALQALQSPDLGGLRSTLLNQVSGLANSPDRFDLAKQAFGTFASQTDPYFQADLRAGTDAAAGGGTLGSGMLNTSLGNITDTRALQLQGERDTLFQNALSQTLQDALNRIGASQSVYGGLSATDLAKAQAQAGIGQDIFGQNLSASNFAAQQAATGLGANEFNSSGGLGAQQFNSQLQQQAAQSAFAQALARAQFGAQQNAQVLSSQQFGQQFQSQQAQLAFANEMAQIQEQAALQQQEFGQNLSTAQLQGMFGFGNDPFSLQLLAGGQAGQQAAAGGGLLANNGYSTALNNALQQLWAQQGLGGLSNTPVTVNNPDPGSLLPPINPTMQPPVLPSPSLNVARMPPQNINDYTMVQPPRAAPQPLAYSPLAMAV